MGLDLYFCIWTSNHSHIICWKDCPYSISLLSHLCWKLMDHTMCGSISGLSLLFHQPVSLFIFPVLYHLDYWICIVFKRGHVSPLNWVFSKTVLVILVPLLFYILNETALTTQINIRMYNLFLKALIVTFQQPV